MNICLCLGSKLVWERKMSFDAHEEKIRKILANDLLLCASLGDVLLKYVRIKGLVIK